jgi:transcriptional regulator with PAS, ATPase and Fis domain
MGKQVKELAPEALEIRPCRNTRAAGGGPQSLEQQERKHIEWVLEQTGGNKSKAAELLGIDRVSLWRKLKRYQVSA